MASYCLIVFAGLVLAISALAEDNTLTLRIARIGSLILFLVALSLALIIIFGPYPVTFPGNDSFTLAGDGKWIPETTRFSLNLAGGRFVHTRQWLSLLVIGHGIVPLAAAFAGDCIYVWRNIILPRLLAGPPRNSLPRKS